MDAKPVLQRFRAFVDARHGNLKRLADESGVPASTLSRMAAPDWYPAAFENLEAISRALAAIDGSPTEASQ
jgi:DNA-binding Xre family transcriptional regulator